MNTKTEKFKASLFFACGIIVFMVLMAIATQCSAQPQEAAQTIHLKRGWNMVSSNLYPINSDMTTIFHDLPIEVVYNLGGLWWLYGNINDIDNWTPETAYRIKCSEGCILYLYGEPVQLPKQIEIKEGINYLPAWSNSLLADVFQGNLDNIFCIVDPNTLKLYCHEWEIYSLTEFTPGTGYLVYSLSNFTLTWPQ